MDIRYPAILKPEETGFFVRFVDLDEAFTEGDTLDEALFNAAEVLTLTLEGRLEENQPVPAPSADVPEAYYIAPDAKVQAALLVRRARGERSLADLARALETSWPASQAPGRSPTLAQPEAARKGRGRAGQAAGAVVRIGRGPAPAPARGSALKPGRVAPVPDPSPPRPPVPNHLRAPGIALPVPAAGRLRASAAVPVRHPQAPNGRGGRAGLASA